MFVIHNQFLTASFLLERMKCVYFTAENTVLRKLPECITSRMQVTAAFVVAECFVFHPPSDCGLQFQLVLMISLFQQVPLFVL